MLLLALFLAAGAPDTTITIQPLPLVFGQPLLVLGGERAIRDGGASVGVTTVGGYLGGVTVGSVGGEVRAYVLGDFAHGLPIGARAAIAFASALGATALATEIGAFAGYKYASSAGPTFGVDVGFLITSVVGGASGTGPAIRLHLGWTS